MRVLCLNAGSSTLKYALFAGETRVSGGTVRDLDEVAAALAGTHTGAGVTPDAIGHRLVHGGAELVAPTNIDAQLLTSLRALVPLAPLHLPAEIALVEAALARWPGVPEVACFDTAFHATLPEEARRLPLPARLHDAGLRRYGFHGLSYEHVVSTLGAASLGRAVIAHLGNGASLAAILGGHSVDTTMGFTPLGGIMMGTRPGDLDPGVVLELSARGEDPARVLERESGLLGVSGDTADMRALLAARETGAPRAALAIAMFCRSARKAIGALAAVLGGIDSLVFTGGIGEHAAPIRAEIARGLEHLGVELDVDRNAAGASPIGAGRCAVHVVPTDEEAVIARHVRAVLAAGSAGAVHSQ